MENVKCGRQEVIEEEVYKACELAFIHDTIISKPGGYDAEIGEKGVKLSSGEKHRLAFARVTVIKPTLAIVVMDEPTSALDSCTEDML
jgi:ABC-type multidrug transport system fused ATPase/permease subunit